MTETLESPSSVADQTRARVERMGAYLRRLLAHTPDDRLGWSPSPTTRSALRLVSHCAGANGFFADTIAGRHPEVQPTPEAFMVGLRVADGQAATREEALAWLDRTEAELVAALAPLRSEDLAALRPSPFGPLPVAFWAESSAEHLTVHAGQLAYLQTMWGDLDDHIG